MSNTRSLVRATLFGASVGGVAVLLAACAADAVKDPGATKARADLTELEASPTLASRAPVAIQDAEAAVSKAEQPQTDHVLAAHLVYLADRRVQIAKAQAQTKYDEDQRRTLSERNAQIQLDARTREADSAKRMNSELQAQTDIANRKSADLQAQTDIANRKSADLQAQTDTANLKNSDLQAALAALQAKQTDRGMVVTLGDLLFSTGRSDLKPGGVSNLDRLATFLNQAPTRNIRIEGHTDNHGGQDLNQALSQKRADAVAMYLTGRGVATNRITSIGEGYASPVADNATEAGRQANRRVEVIIQNPPQ